MLIYFDESYDNNKQRLLLGALFNPHPKFLHRKLKEIKDKYKFYKKDGTPIELKYSKIKDKKSYSIAEEIVDAFFESTSYFRCIAIEQGADRFSLDYFGAREEKKMKEAIMYKKFTELLISHNTENLFNAVLLTDELTRCKGDIFFALMSDIFCIPGQHHSLNKKEPTIKEIKEIRSSLEQYHVLQICDVLMGSILNQLCPGSNKWKKKISKHICKRIQKKGLTRDDWNIYSKNHTEEHSPKYNVRFRDPRKLKKQKTQDSHKY